MATQDDPKDNAAPGEQEQPFRLDHEITRKYDPAALSRLIMRDAGRGEPLDLHTRSLMERRLGGDFRSVRIVRGPLAEEVTARYRADAVTVGGTELVLVREGWRGNFQTAEGRALLGHELTHIQQQQRGLHFALTHEGGNGPLEEDAHLHEHLIKAEEQGHQMAQESEKRRVDTERKIWDRVKHRVKKMKEEQKEKSDLRSGATVSGNYLQR